MTENKAYFSDKLTLKAVKIYTRGCRLGSCLKTLPGKNFHKSVFMHILGLARSNPT